MTAATTPRTDDLTALDWEPDLPCENWRDNAPGCDITATWHIRYQWQHRDVTDDLLLCDTCKREMLTHHSKCRNCLDQLTILSVEPLR